MKNTVSTRVVFHRSLIGHLTVWRRASHLFLKEKLWDSLPLIFCRAGSQSSALVAPSWRSFIFTQKKRGIKSWDWVGKTWPHVYHEFIIKIESDSRVMTTRSHRPPDQSNPLKVTFTLFLRPDPHSHQIRSTTPVSTFPIKRSNGYRYSQNFTIVCKMQVPFSL